VFIVFYKFSPRESEVIEWVGKIITFLIFLAYVICVSVCHLKLFPQFGSKWAQFDVKKYAIQIFELLCRSWDLRGFTHFYRKICKKSTPMRFALLLHAQVCNLYTKFLPSSLQTEEWEGADWSACSLVEGTDFSSTKSAYLLNL